MKLSQIIPVVSVLATGQNKSLPPLPAWQAASFWAQVLLALSVALNAVGIDLFAVLSGMGLGATPEEVVSTGHKVARAVQELLPFVFGVWAWIERKAPTFRLVFWRRGEK